MYRKKYKLGIVEIKERRKYIMKKWTQRIMKASKRKMGEDIGVSCIWHEEMKEGLP